MLATIQRKLRKDSYDIYTLFDENGDGFININELKAVFQKIDFVVSDEQLIDMKNVLDSNKDGKLNYYEFLSYLKKAEQAL